MKRKIDFELKNWKDAPERKVLLLRGARQVGKTYSVRALGKTFEHFLEINFEESQEVKTFFEGSLDPKALCEKLTAYSNIPLIPGKSLLFFDEIQACPDALRSLRFFYEKMPGLHVVAAGSLLEFVLSEIPSFGVGRITSLYVYPLSFYEFLWATGNDALYELLKEKNISDPLDEPLHTKLLDLYRTHQIIGGLPEVVDAYSQERDLRACQMIIDQLRGSIIDDFAKYKKNIPQSKLEETFRSIAFQAGGKFKYANISTEESSKDYKNALELLIQAGLAYTIYHTSAQGIPLGTHIDHKKFKAILFDTGIHQRIVGLDLAQYLITKGQKLINEGNLAEVYVGLELAKASPSLLKPQLYYWHREAKSANAEVDYVIQKNDEIIPLEVKSGTKGQMQSMYIFLNERNLQKGIRLSQENFGVYDSIQTIPIYATEKAATYITPH